MTCRLFYKLTRQWMFFFLMSFVLLFFLSPDSYVRQVFGRLDSAMFFTQGHAWLKGMVPYVDFTDSKGPLLLAIYALGAWLSPTTYHGVFWISVVYTLIFFFLYHATRLLLDDHDGHRALAATILCVGGGACFQSYMLRHVPRTSAHSLSQRRYGRCCALPSSTATRQGPRDPSPGKAMTAPYRSSSLASP